MSTAYEGERRGGAWRTRKDKTLSDLAIEIVGDDPLASNARLVRRWASQVQGDDDLLEACLTVQGNHEIILARNHWGRQENKKDRGKNKAEAARQDRRRKKIEDVTTKAARKTLAQLLEFTAENGKKIKDLTGDELAKLETDNAARATLYRELRKRVKGKQIVGEVLSEKVFKKIMHKIADLPELRDLFRRQ